MRWLSGACLAERAPSLLSLAALAACASQGNPRAPLAEARFAHTATLLTDGSVLVTGGQGTKGSLATVERYDPDDDAWTTAPRMAYRRQAHSAIRLLDGRVLVTGGSGDDGTSVTAELYDPVTEDWSPAARMGTARHGHHSVLLRDGRVLVAGGCICALAEIYDPLSDTWERTGDLTAPRVFTSLAPLPDGGAFLVGMIEGQSSALDGQQAERFDAAEGTWRRTAPGTLYVASVVATVVALPSGAILVIGDLVDPGAAALYDAATNTWASAGAMSVARRASGIALPAGKVLVPGGNPFHEDRERGFGWTGSSTSTTEIFDPLTRSFSLGPELAEARTGPAMVVLEDSVLLVGGAHIRVDVTGEGSTTSTTTPLASVEAVRVD
jgi:hypothetical protein